MNWYKIAQENEGIDEDLEFVAESPWKPVDSSFITEAAYCESLKIFEVKINGIEYRFDGVPKKVYEGFLDSPSKGEYFNRVIRKNYGIKRD
jgi:hypothetical protein